MNQSVTPQQIISLTEARSNLSKLVKETERDKLFFLTKGGKPKVVLVGINLWSKINRDVRRFTQKTFITPQVLPFTRDFSDKEIKRWLKEDKLTPKQREIIAKSEKT